MLLLWIPRLSLSLPGMHQNDQWLLLSQMPTCVTPWSDRTCLTQEVAHLTHPLSDLVVDMCACVTAWIVYWVGDWCDVWTGARPLTEPLWTPAAKQFSPAFPRWRRCESLSLSSLSSLSPPFFNPCPSRNSLWEWVRGRFPTPPPHRNPPNMTLNVWEKHCLEDTFKDQKKMKQVKTDKCDSEMGGKNKHQRGFKPNSRCPRKWDGGNLRIMVTERVKEWRWASVNPKETSYHSLWNCFVFVFHPVCVFTYTHWPQSHVLIPQLSHTWNDAHHLLYCLEQETFPPFLLFSSISFLPPVNEKHMHIHLLEDGFHNLNSTNSVSVCIQVHL